MSNMIGGIILTILGVFFLIDYIHIRKSLNERNIELKYQKDRYNGLLKTCDAIREKYK